MTSPSDTGHAPQSTATPTAASAPDAPSVEDFIDDMVARWRAGERPPTEEYLGRRPELWHNAEAALELIAEELVLREEFGEPVSSEDLIRRFPQWWAQVEVLLDCQRTLGGRLPPARFPDPGDQIGDFVLLSELGRGAHGRAYLATQPMLAGRPVVLKLGPSAGGEHLSLARLQHTHIVPLYSAHEFPDWGLRGLCLPHFGGATLAEILKTEGPVSVKNLFSPTREPAQGAPSPSRPITRGPGNEYLEIATPWEAVCWIGACLADALQYAHDRGLLHLDLKPSNVLIAADGTPMLLDFHLAHPPVRAGEPTPAWVGGTVGYMAPEQEAAMRAVEAGRPLPDDLDGRADVFALGVLLNELWNKLSPARDRRSVGLGDVLARCTAARAQDRYASAAELARDLRRHLLALPLKGVGNRSLAERWRKWRRRRPLALPAAIALAALVVIAVGLFRYADRQVRRAESALADAQAQLDRGRFKEAGDLARNGEALIDGVPFQGSLRGRLGSARQSADRGQAANELHQLSEQVRPLYAAEGLAPAQARAAADLCRTLWDRREEIARTLANQPNAELERQWRADLLDIGVLLARLGVRAAPPDSEAEARGQALNILTDAENLIGPSAALLLERAEHAGAVGMGPVAEEATRRAHALPPVTAWDHLVVGRSHLARGDLAQAAVALDRCLELDPRSIWGHYFRGVTCLRRGDATEAVAAFSACATLAPDSAWCLYNRGLAYTAAGRSDRALADFDRAVTLDPKLAVAYVGRAAVHHRAGRYEDARADLRRAGEAGLAPADVEYQTALVWLAARDREAALTAVRACLSHDPKHPQGRELLARLDPK
ncbi:MAG TPA: serine/threonine-protein kinase [Gemmataceae bacterium]|nr:serine/threonine-protein kinase [Gemmataceae bacterium]